VRGCELSRRPEAPFEDFRLRVIQYPQREILVSCVIPVGYHYDGARIAKRDATSPRVGQGDDAARDELIPLVWRHFTPNANIASAANVRATPFKPPRL
jgi:hypothetical protein